MTFTQIWPNPATRVVLETQFQAGGSPYASSDFISVLPKHLTLDPTYRSARLLQKHRTLFKEVHFVPYTVVETPEMQELFATPVGTIKQTQRQLFAEVMKAFERFVYDNWEPDCYHVILNSSGYDSRVLSWTLRNLRQTYGDDWLGHYLFICSKWEAQSFKQIMEYEGWDADHYWVPDEDLPADEYYKNSLLDFANAWREYNCYAAIPINITYWPVKRALAYGKVPSNCLIQTWTTQWGNTMFDDGSGKHGGKGVRDLAAQLYYSVLGIRPTYGHYICKPFQSIDVARPIYQSSVRLGLQCRLELQKFLDPTLAEFKNMRADGDRHRPISPRIMEQVVKDYRKSWYGTDVFPDARPARRDTEFQTWWHHWTAASLCECLRNNGYEIKVGKR